MKEDQKWDFSGYATKANLKCTDGRVIEHGAFKGSHGKTVPLVWHHFHELPANILGKVFLEHRDDGTYAYGLFNDTPAGQNAKMLVQHGDIDSLSIFANQLIQNGSNVRDGVIREVSLVLAGANPGAKIEQVSFTHSDGTTDLADDEAIIFTGIYFNTSKAVQHDSTAGSDPTVQQVFDSMTEEQQTVVYIMVSQALEEAQGQSGQSVQQSDLEGDDKYMKHNAFDEGTSPEKVVITPDQFKAIAADTTKYGGSFKHALLAHAGEYGIDNIDVLFPEVQTVTPTPAMISRKVEWVSSFLGGSKHVPFSRIKSTYANITADEARAKGYVKGALKVEEVIAAFKRTTLPTTIYKKQKLDRDDIIDITDFDVVAWLWAEMRVMLDEEVARAGLLGDGRALTGDPDKIDETCVRPIYSDSDVYVERVRLTSTKTANDMIEAIIRARKNYRGTGSLVLYATADTIVDMLLIKDTTMRYVYDNKQQLAAKLMVSDIVEVPLMDGVARVDTAPTPDVTLHLKAILVNPNDYTYGANKGGELGKFDFFDIDYNQQKYLMETRLSAALTLPKSAIVVEQEAASG